MPKRLTDAETVPVMQAAGLEPLEPYPGAAKPWRCRCEVCGAVGTPQYHNIKKGRGGCEPCGIVKRGLSRKVDDAEAVAVMKAAGVTPQEAYPGARLPWRCRCDTCGKEVHPWYSSVKGGRSGCVYCAGRRVDEKDVIAVLAERGLTPLESYPGALKPWRCRCDTCGNEVRPWWAGIQQGQSGCRFCAGAAVDPEAAAELMRTAGLEPLTPYPGRNNVGWLARCLECEREVMPAYDAVQAGGGCKYCNAGGFRFGDPALIYLLVHEDLALFKVGITNEGTARIARFVRRGFECQDTLRFETGDEAYELEQLIHAYLRTLDSRPTPAEDKAYALRVSKAVGGFAGHTEVYDLNRVTPERLTRLLEQAQQTPGS